MSKITYFKGFLCSVFILFNTIANAEWVDISTSVEIEKTKVAYDRVNRVMFSYVHITNTSGAEISGDIQLNIFNQSKPTINHYGTLEDSSVYYLVPDGNIPNGATKTVKLEFARARGSISFDTKLEKIGFIKSNAAFDYNPPSSTRYVKSERQKYIDGSFVVMFHSPPSTEELDVIANDIGATVQGSSHLLPIYMFLISRSGLDLMQMKDIEKKLNGYSEVSYATINLISSVKFSHVPDTQNKAPNNQYYLQRANIIKAWDSLKQVGGKNIKVGVIDAPLIGHPDLRVQLHRCENDNSCRDDVDIFTDEGITNIDSDVDHGNFVTGIIGAAHGNGQGISGIMHEKEIHHPKIQLIGNDSSIFSVAGALQTLIILDKVKLINMSLGNDVEIKAFNGKNYCIFPTKGRGEELLLILQEPSFNDNCERLWLSKENFVASDILSKEAHDAEIAYYNEKFFKLEKSGDESDQDRYGPILKEVIEYADNNVLFIQAAGNENMLADYSGGPCSITDPLLEKSTLCVGSIANTPENVEYRLSDFSNYGRSVDIATFGENIKSTSIIGKPDSIEGFLSQNGTSFSAPIVTGVAGLIWNAFPQLTAHQVKESLIIGTSSRVDDKFSAYNIPVLDAYQALLKAEELALGNYPIPNVAQVTGLSPLTATINKLTTFTITGKNLPSSITAQLDDADCDAPNFIADTRVDVNCTPRTIGDSFFHLTDLAGEYIQGTDQRTVVITEGDSPLAIESFGIYKINGEIYQGSQTESVSITKGDTIEFFMRRSGVDYLQYQPSEPFYGYAEILLNGFSFPLTEDSNDNSLLKSPYPVNYDSIGTFSTSYKLWSYSQVYDEKVAPNLIIEPKKIFSIDVEDSVIDADGLRHVYTESNEYYIPGGYWFLVTVKGDFSSSSRVDMLYGDGNGCDVKENNGIDQIVFRCRIFLAGMTRVWFRGAQNDDFFEVPEGGLDLYFHAHERPVIGNFVGSGGIQRAGVTRNYGWKLSHPEGAYMTVDFMDGQGEIMLEPNGVGEFYFDKAFDSAGTHNYVIRAYNSLDMLAHEINEYVNIYSDP